MDTWPGLSSLTRIFINNGVVAIGRIDRAQAEIIGVDGAVKLTALVRTRSICMTNVTMVCKLPLVRFGGEIGYGLAIVIVEGLISSP